jgi:hypothetical protein
MKSTHTLTLQHNRKEIMKFSFSLSYSILRERKSFKVCVVVDLARENCIHVSILFQRKISLQVSFATIRRVFTAREFFNPKKKQQTKIR